MAPRPLLQRQLLALSTRHDKFELYSGQQVPANKQRFIPTSGSYPKGFTVGSIWAGIKPPGNHQPNLLMVASDAPAPAAAVFTKNKFCAASVTVSHELMRWTKGVGLRGVIANLGCANLLTGQAGFDDATVMGRKASRAISPAASDAGSSFMVIHTGAGGRR